MKKRDRAWRRFQDRKVINKRLKIAKDCWFSGSCYDGKHNQFEKWLNVNPGGSLRKYNFTCRCEMCRMERHEHKRDRKQREEELKRNFNEEYGSIVYF